MFSGEQEIVNGRYFHADVPRLHSTGLLCCNLQFPITVRDVITGPIPSGYAQGGLALPTCAKAAVKLWTTTGDRGDVLGLRGDFLGTTHAGLMLTGPVPIMGLIPDGLSHFLWFFQFSACPEVRLETCARCGSCSQRASQGGALGISPPASVVLELVHRDTGPGLIIASPALGGVDARGGMVPLDARLGARAARVDAAPNGTVVPRNAFGDLASNTAANAPVSLLSPGVRRLHHFFEATSDRVPDNIAVEDADHRVSYRELDRQANQLAHMLRGLNIKAGSRVGILLHRSLLTYVSLLAILKAGAAFVPIDPGSPQDRIAYIVDDSGLDLVITSTEFAAVTADLGQSRLELDRLADALAACPVSRVAANDGGDGDPLCYVIYTSGSSGRPKGVEVAQSSICNFINVVSRAYDVRQSDRVYQGMTIAFDFSIEEIWPTFTVGATVVVGPNDSRRLGSELSEFLNDTGVTVFYCVPTLLATLSGDLPTVRSLIVGGEACPAELVQRWSSPGRRILNTYGPTEATVTATCGELRAGRPVTIGRALPTYQVVLLDSELQPVPAGDIGEICIGGPGVARGYVGRPDLTAARFVRHRLARNAGRLYRTGDLGRLLASGEIEYCGRADTQVKIRGYRIELTEIESVLAQMPGIAQAVVDTYQPEPGLVELVGYYRLDRDTSSVDQQRLYQHLRAHLPAYMVPAYLEVLDVIPVLPSDKADRHKLPAPTGPRSLATGHDYTGPVTDTERLLADALAAVMCVDRVSIESNFFDDLGANSLVMAHFCTLVRRNEHLPAVSMKDIYLHPTVRALAAALPVASGAPATRRIEQPSRAARASRSQYLLCGTLQILLFVGYIYVAGLPLAGGVEWISAGAGFTDTCLRSLAFGAASFVSLCIAPIVAKWLLIGRWKPQEIPIWSLAYIRFWTAKTFIRSSPLVLFAGSPLYVAYLRSLGARIGPGVVIFSRNVPVCTDLLTIGEGTVIRKDCYLNCYRAHAGLIQTGAVTVGRNVVIGETSVLDINTELSDGAQLGHASCLHTSQAVPAGQRWHGSPAQRCDVDYRAVGPTRCGTVRRVCFSVLQVLNVLVSLSLAQSVLVTYLPRVPVVADVLALGQTNLAQWTFYLQALAGSFVLFFGGLAAGMLFVFTVPRALNLVLSTDRVYPLYGFHYWAQRMISRVTNAQTYMTIFGDSSYIVHYLRMLGWDLSGVVQTGSNFGIEQKHESPYLSRVATGTMVSDGLSMMNTTFSSTSFSMSQVSIGANSFFGNNIAYPPAAKIGNNCLLGTKTMVPLDGPVRENVGLLGSPCFEIPRSVRRDSRFDHLKGGAEFHSRLAAKNRHNLVTMGLYLLTQWSRYYIIILVGLIALAFYHLLGALVIPLATVITLLVTVAYSVLLERAAGGFRALNPQFCSIYDNYFWWHERLWKMFAPNFFAGTPLRTVIWRLLGVRIGSKVFDDGSGIAEKSLVTIGDGCTLNAGAVIQCHSLEDGTFKSDHTTIGSNCTLGIGAFVHYGVTISDDAVLAPDSFLMKGEEIPPHAQWGGNPAKQIPAATPHETER